MTNQTIPPCPVCGKVPEINEEKIYCNCPHNCGEYKTRIDVVQTCDCEHFCYPIYPANAGNSLYTWVDTVETLLGRACRELGIETVEQLKAKVRPDPRAALLEELGLHSTDDVRSVVGKAVAYNRQTPDPRVAVLEDGIRVALQMCGYKKVGEIESANRYETLDALGLLTQLIAAQRGEG